MKIVALSLLRLGDLLMHQEVLHILQQEYPQARIDLVINDSVSAGRELISGIGKLHLFPRRKLQDNLVLKDQSFFRALKIIRDWGTLLNTEDYDLVVDLTHTRFSRALVGALKIKEMARPKKSLMNDVFARSSQSSFHYLDALKHSLGLPTFSQFPKARDPNGGPLVIQPLTSDSKKNWSLGNFKIFISNVRSAFPSQDFIVVGSPNEADVLKKEFGSLEGVSIAICGLLELKEILLSADFLVSGDTATIHLAAQTSTPCLGLYLGSAESSKTAPRLEGAWVLQSLEACAPCRHANPCLQAQHLCGLSMNPSSVFDIYKAIRQGQLAEVQALAWKLPFSVYSVQKNPLGQLVLWNLSSADSPAEQSFRQSAFLKQYRGVETSPEVLLSCYRGENWELSMYVNERSRHVQRAIAAIEDLQTEVRSISKSCLQQDPDMTEHLTRLQPLIKDFELLAEDAEWASCLNVSLNESWIENSFTVYRNWRVLTDNLKNFYEEQNISLAALRKLLHEKGVFYVPGPTRST